MEFTEDLLHYVWKTNLLPLGKLQTTQGEPLQIVKLGNPNSDSGPDFQQALLNIGHLHWSGSVEMHIRSSDWYKHRHDTDPAYESVILHVVYQHDRPVFRKDGSEIPVLELQSFIPKALIVGYRDLLSSRAWIPCAAALPEVDPFFVHSWLSRVLLERLEAKSDAIIAVVEEFKGSWDQAFYVMLARNFGFKVNALPFECLSRSLPQTLLARHQQQPLQIEALIFGQSGFLEQELTEAYPERLKKEYEYLRKKYRLSPMEASIWKFMRLRPANFPMLRLAQFAALVVKSHRLFATILETSDLNALRQFFCDLPINPFWGTHYHFTKTSGLRSMQLGASSIDNLLINTIAPFLFAYGRFHQQESYRHLAVRLLETVPAERNHIVQKFKQLGVQIDSASGSQAVLQLKQHYCESKKCLSCGIGNRVLRPATHLT